MIPEEKIKKMQREVMSNEKTSLTYKIGCLQSQGYTCEFQITEEGLKSLDSGEVFQPEDITIIEHERFEGFSNPDDMSILYIIETKSGLKGTIVDAFGMYANSDLIDFMKKVKDITTASITNATIKNCV